MQHRIAGNILVRHSQEAAKMCPGQIVNARVHNLNYPYERYRNVFCRLVFQRRDWHNKYTIWPLICRNDIPVNILVIQSDFAIAFSQILQFHSVIFESVQYHRKTRRNRNWQARIRTNPEKFRKIYRLQPPFML